MNVFSLSPLAAGDVDDIWFYFAEFDPENANRFLLEILQVFRMLAET